MGVRRVSTSTLLVLTAVVATALGGTAAAFPSTRAPVVAEGASPDPVLAAAGDIACDPLSLKYNFGQGSDKACRQKFTSDLLFDPAVTAVATLGDNAYQCGAGASYSTSYNDSWGRLLGETHPSTGNHDYLTSGASGTTSGCTTANKGAKGYYGYFGDRAGAVGQGWYSYTLGTWHVVVLNSNCTKVGGCGAGSPQYQWLAQDLAGNSSACTLAYWHHPLFAAGDKDALETKPFWDLLIQNHADLVLNGHRHWYERIAPVNANGVIDPASGIRELVVGTGGENHESAATRGPISEVYDNQTFGVIKVALHPTGYDWNFVPVAGATFTDSGSGNCHGPGTDTAAPQVPTGLTADVATAPSRVGLSWTAPDDTDVEGYRILRNGTPVGYTTSGTTYTDSRVVSGSTYSYTVQAYDTSGNQSGASDPATAIVPGAATVITIPASADGRVTSGQPRKNFGTVSPLIVDGTPKVRSFLRFDTSSLAGKTVLNAKLRLWCTNASSSGGAVYATDGSGWTESTLSWTTMPGLGALVGNLGAVMAASSRQVDVSSAVTGGSSTVDLALTSTMADNAAYLSRETTNANRRPALLVTVR